MKTTSKLQIVVAVACAGAVACSDTHDGKVDAGTDPLATPVSTEKLPGLEFPLPHECPVDLTTQVSVEEWAAAADAIIIGTIAEIRMSDLAWVSHSGYDGPEVIPVERCREEWRGSLSGFRIRLNEVTSITGNVPESLYLDFGTYALSMFEREAAPVVQDYQVAWKDETRGLRPGMRIGGAVFLSEEFGLYTFATYGSQAFFIEENGRLFFQPYVGPNCFPLIPPLDALGGEELGTVASRLATAAVSVTPLKRESSELRGRVLFTEHPRGMHPGCFFPACTPEDYEWH